MHFCAFRSRWPFGSALQEALDVDEEEEATAEQWRHALRCRLGFSDVELDRLLPMMDIDGIDGISVAELRSVLLLVEPRISSEGSRKKVQQGYRSIEIALQKVLKKVGVDQKKGLRYSYPTSSSSEATPHFFTKHSIKAYHLTIKSKA